jgi:hypothetical protein
VHPNCQCVTEPVVAPKSMTASERAVLDNYVTGKGVEMSRALRKGKISKPLESEARALTGAIDRLGENLSDDVYRAVDGAHLSDEARALLTEGETFLERGFSSTSVDKTFVSDWAAQLREPIIFEIRGAKGLDVEKAASENVVSLFRRKPQREMLLKPGTRYKVEGIREETFFWETGQREFTAKVVTVTAS